LLNINVFQMHVYFDVQIPKVTVTELLRRDTAIAVETLVNSLAVDAHKVGITVARLFHDAHWTISLVALCTGRVLSIPTE
jgi:hypothetical protein